MEVVTGVTAPRQPLVSELDVTNYRTNVTALLQELKRSLSWILSQTEGTRCKIFKFQSIITNAHIHESL